VVKLAQFSTGGVAHYCIGGNTQIKKHRKGAIYCVFTQYHKGCLYLGMMSVD
jgi:hypothetical protein